MKIIVIVRTLNEQLNISTFCRTYGDIADTILVADGGSEDNTVVIAESFSNVEVRHYKGRLEMKNNYWRNPRGEHINFLVDWAEEEGADWIIFDDCDCSPNYLLRKDGRQILEEAKTQYVRATRLYLWMDGSRHFPKLAQPRGKGIWEASLWAWRANLGIRFKVSDEPHQGLEVAPEKRNTFSSHPPHCLLHRPWQTEERLQKKLAFYRESGAIPAMLHPLDFGGTLEPIPEYARNDEI
jgi:glycosyltransferase involved in cell wall biosynthesis